MIDAGQLQTLSPLLRVGSFEGAAQVLGVTQSAVSQRIRALEDRVGQPLVLRGTPCLGTALGDRLARHAEDVALMEAQVLGDLAEAGQGQRTVRIAVNADSLASWFLPALARAQEALPGLFYDLVVDDQDHSGDWLRKGEVAGAVSAHAVPPTGCDSHPLGDLRYVAVASPEFLARHCPDGITGPALRAAPMMTYDRKDRLQLDWLEQCFGPGPVPATHYLPSTQAFTEAAALGLGWAVNPLSLVQPVLDVGRLVVLRPDQPLDTPLYWQVSRRMAPALAPATRAICAAARRALITDPTG